MRTSQAKPTSLSLFVDSIIEMERVAAPVSVPASHALRAAIEAMDQAFQLAGLLASGVDPKSKEVRVPFTFAVAKLMQTNELLGLPANSPEAMCLDILSGVAEPSSSQRSGDGTPHPIIA